MTYIVKLFKMIWEGFVSTINWIAGVPALVISSVVGLWTSVSSLIDQFTEGGDMASEIAESFSAAVSPLIEMVEQFPDVMKVAMYCLSVDVMFDGILTVLGLFLSLSCSFLVFFAVTIPGWLFALYLTKFTAFTLTILLPQQWVISGLSSLANMNISANFAKPLRDGKFDFRLGG